MEITQDIVKGRKLMAVRLERSLYFYGGDQSFRLYHNGCIQAGRYPSLDRILRDNEGAVAIYEGDSITLTF